MRSEPLANLFARHRAEDRCDMTKKKRRVYKPRVVGDRIMMPADLKRLHKYMLEIEGVDAISDEMRTGRGKRMAGLELHSRTGSASV